MGATKRIIISLLKEIEHLIFFYQTTMLIVIFGAAEAPEGPS